MKDYAKYIKVADAVKILFDDCIRYVFPTTAEPTTEFIKLDNAINLLRLYPSEDVEPVVRCKDCKHRIKWKESYGCSFWGYYGDEFADGEMFCSKGKRKENDE